MDSQDKLAGRLIAGLFIVIGIITAGTMVFRAAPNEPFLTLLPRFITIALSFVIAFRYLRFGRNLPPAFRNFVIIFGIFVFISSIILIFA